MLVVSGARAFRICLLEQVARYEYCCFYFPDELCDDGVECVDEGEAGRGVDRRES